MKSVRCTSIIRRVPPVEHEAVSVGIVERRHVADAGVVRLVGELDAAGLELLARLGDVCNAQRDRRTVPLPELPADRRRVDQVEEDVVAKLELGEAALAGLGQSERVAVPRNRALQVGDGHADEVDVLDVHASNLRCSRSALPSGSLKKAIRQTPVSTVSPSNTTPFSSSSARAASTSPTRSATPAGDTANGCPMLDGSKTSSVTWPQRNSRSFSPSDSISRPSVSA